MGRSAAASLLAFACSSSHSRTPPEAPKATAPPAPTTAMHASSSGGDDACRAAGALALSDLPEAGLVGALVLEPGDVACLERHVGALAAVAAAPKEAAHLAVRLLTRDGTSVLQVYNGYTVALEVRALLRVEGTAGWQETRIAPVLPGFSGWETWPHPIGGLALHDFQFKELAAESGSSPI